MKSQSSFCEPRAADTTLLKNAPICMRLRAARNNGLPDPTGPLSRLSHEHSANLIKGSWLGMKCQRPGIVIGSES